MASELLLKGKLAGEEMMKDNEKAVDSLISFKDILEEKKDSIATLPLEEQKKLSGIFSALFIWPVKQFCTLVFLNFLVPYSIHTKLYMWYFVLHIVS